VRDHAAVRYDAASAIPPGKKRQSEQGKKNVEQNQWGARAEDLAVSLLASQTVNRSGGPALVRMSLKNFGLQLATIVVTTPWSDYEFALRDESGREVPRQNMPIVPGKPPRWGGGLCANCCLAPPPMIRWNSVACSS
jgi:hypothetical protein